ncbi:beta-propeller fold lactonase family protein [Bacillus sp. CGMCC 1.60114]|uniref:beta-propeller fold lactonase family protein n=1 Tax=unclassified Bacillus (in: firmicutes) TaxID=185979 RepID=UPI00362E509D
MLKKMKVNGVLIVALMFVVIFPAAIFASSTENKSSIAVESFDGSITNNSLAISPDEQIAVVSDSREQSIRIYDLAKGTLRKKIDGFVTPRNIVFVDNGSEFVVSDSTLGTLRFYNTKSLTLKDEVVVGPGAFGTAVSPDGKTLYVNNQAHSSVTIVDLEKRKPTAVITGFAQPRQGIKVSPDGKYVFVTNFKGDKVSVVDAATKNIVREITGFSMIRGISVSADGQTMYAANSGRDSISVVDISQGQIVNEVKVGREPYGAALSPDGKLLFASSKVDNTIDVIDVSNNHVIKTISGFAEPRQAIVFSQDGERAYVLNRDLSIARVNVKTLSMTDTISEKSSKYKLQVLESDGIGKYLADDKGMTLYYFTKDEPGVSNCKGKCSEIWPSFHAENIVAPSGFNKSDFETITREDGQKQTTYKGHPLYYFNKDKQVGDINGQGVNNVWYVLTKKIFEK